MAEFQREHRYWVIKRKHLTREQDEELRIWIEQIGLPPLECVCVESDWPIYEETWENVQRLAEGKESIGKELALKRSEFGRLVGELARALGYDAPSPSLCDLVSEAEAVKRQLGALAAHVDRLQELLRWGRDVVLLDSLSARNWNGAAGRALVDKPETSLACRDLLKQAEKLEKMAESPRKWEPGDLWSESAKLRRQAEEGR